MSQPTNINVATSKTTGRTEPANFTAELNAIIDAFRSSHSGSTRPSYAQAGMLWHDSDDDAVYFYDGTNDHLIFRRDNVLGTVSQSGGVPTGAVIERGSNANGRYVRWADGTQICTVTLSSSASASTTWTFPASFSGLDSLSVSPASGSPRFVGFSAATTTTADFDAWASDGTTRVAINCRLTAIGRWF